MMLVKIQQFFLQFRMILINQIIDFNQIIALNIALKSHKLDVISSFLSEKNTNFLHELPKIGNFTEKLKLWDAILLFL